ncbi:MAG: hypothetical protein LBT87_09635 [Treponema sp.]|jgi:hypothetical protein|nr:hypothetical protein [Treponema sp.]
MKSHIAEGDTRRHRNLFFGTLVLVLTGLLAASCTDFYSTTWGEALARDPSKVKVTTSNVNELLKDANGDTEASRAILEKLKGTDNPALQAAAIKAANQAAGLTELVLSNLGTLTGGSETNENALLEVAQTVLGQAKKNDISGVADDIAKTLAKNVVEENGAPRFTDDSFAKSVSTSDLTLLLVTMMMGEASKAAGDFESYANDWGSSKTVDGTGLGDNEKIIAAVANEVIDRPDSELGNMLKALVGAN